MVYYIYKVVNIQNGKYYIGKRQYNGDINVDKYLGSGLLIKRAIKKYGRASFNKSIIKVCGSLEELNQEEKNIITNDVINCPNSYNIALGGKGGNLGEIAIANLRAVCQSESYRNKMSAIINDPALKAQISNSIKRTMSDMGWKDSFSKTQKMVQNLPHNKERNSQNQIKAQSRIDVILKKRNRMNQLYNDVEFSTKHKIGCNTESFKYSQREKLLGKKWIHHKTNAIQKYVSQQDIPDHLVNGWELGMLQRSH
jgi:hypothetical protein